jgi:hypothetical protein
VGEHYWQPILRFSPRSRRAEDNARRKPPSFRNMREGDDEIAHAAVGPRHHQSGKSFAPLSRRRSPPARARAQVRPLVRDPVFPSLLKNGRAHLIPRKREVRDVFRRHVFYALINRLSSSPSILRVNTWEGRKSKKVLSIGKK